MSLIIWEAEGPVRHDRGGGSHLGYYTGDRESVINWITLNKEPEFRETLGKTNGGKLREIDVLHVTPEKVKKLEEALAQKNKAEQDLAAAKDAAKQAATD